MRIFYTAFGTQMLYEVIRGQVPEGMTLVTLDQDSDEERHAKIAECEIVIQANATFPARMVTAASRLRLVLHQGVGYQDTVDLDALKQRGIRLALTMDGTVDSVAEHTVLLILAVCRHIVFADQELRRGRFHRHSLRPVSPELRDRTIGYVGMGQIAQGVASRLKEFKTCGIYCNNSGPLSQVREQQLGISHRSFDEILGNADVLTLHLPLNPSTRGMIDAAAIAKMKPGSILINTARGGLVDELALASALGSGHLLGAGLDVFSDEPIGLQHPLCALPNVVLTPHFAAGTVDAFRRKMQAIFDNASRYQRGEELLNEVRF